MREKVGFQKFGRNAMVTVTGRYFKNYPDFPCINVDENIAHVNGQKLVYSGAGGFCFKVGKNSPLVNASEYFLRFRVGLQD